MAKILRLIMSTLLTSNRPILRRPLYFARSFDSSSLNSKVVRGRYLREGFGMVLLRLAQALSLLMFSFSTSIICTANAQTVKASSTGKTVLFQSLSDKRRRYYYRIPSLVVVNKSKTMVAFAEQRVGSNEDSGDINVVYRISHDNGSNWSRIYKACELQKDTCGNPTAVVDQTTGVIHLFMMSNPGDKAQSDPTKPPFGVGDRRVRYLRAKVLDNGLLGFSDTLNDDYSHLQPAGTKMDVIGPGVGIQLTSASSNYKGRLLVPAGHRTFISDDHGKNWRLSRTLMEKLSSEAAIVELDNGDIFRNDRSTGANRCRKDEFGNLLPDSPVCRRSVSWSTNHGESYTVPSINHRLFDPIAQGSMLRYSEGNIFFANCYSTTNRRNLVIQKTLDGKEWFQAKKVDEKCGYSSMAKTRDYHLAILYERLSVNNKYAPADTKAQELIFQKFKLSDF